MKRTMFISNSLDELEDAQSELLSAGLSSQQIHVLSEDDAGIRQHHLQGVNSLAKTDIVHSTLRGAVVGLAASILALTLPYTAGLVAEMGWTPFILLSIIMLGFPAWEGGLWGIQQFNHAYKNLEEELHQGAHIMIIDFKAFQQGSIQTMAEHHPNMLSA